MNRWKTIKFGIFLNADAFRAFTAQERRVSALAHQELGFPVLFSDATKRSTSRQSVKRASRFFKSVLGTGEDVEIFLEIKYRKVNKQSTRKEKI